MTGLIIFVIVLMLSSYELSKRDWFSPGVLTCGIWLVGLILFQTMPHPLPPLTNNFILCAGLWIALYSTSSLFMQSFNYSAEQKSINPIVYEIYYWVSICCIPFLIIFVIQAIRYGTSGNWAMDLRLAALGNGRFAQSGSYTPFYFTLWQVTYLLALSKIDKKHWKRAVVMGILVLAFGIATMAKFVLFSFGIMTMVILYNKKIIKIGHIAIIVSALLAFMLIQHAIRQGVIYDKDSLREVIELYVLRNYTAFDTLKPCTSEHWGENVFRIYYAITYKLGLSSTEPIDPILPFIIKPAFTNTYTCLYPFYKDFGQTGIVIAAILTGGLMGWIYRKKQLGSSYFTLLFAYICTAIIIQYNSEFVMMNLSGHVKAALLLYIPFIVTIPKKNE